MSDLFYVVSVADNDNGATDSFVYEDLTDAERQMADLRYWGSAKHVCWTPVSRTLDPITLAREVLRAGEAAWHMWDESNRA